jgi:polysaccharide export outer membrane protein
MGSTEATMTYARNLLLALAVVVLGGCALPNGAGPAGLDSAPVAAETYRIGPDDRLQVNVWRNPDLSVAVPVRPDGMISVPLVGDVLAGGRTPAEVSAAVEEKLGRYVKEPQVTVIVTELHSHEFISRIRITGAVTTPASLPFRQGMTVLDAVLEAGGATDFAAMDRARLYRKNGSKTEVIPIALGKILGRGDLQTNVYLMPGDIISVPERLF